MKQFLTFLKKEFYHIIRDKRTLFVLFGIPIAQIILFGFALSNEVKNTKLSILDLSKDHQSIALTEQLKESEFFDLVSVANNIDEVDKILRSGIAKMAVVIPTNFAENLNHEKQAQIQLITDGANPNMATALVNFASSIIRDFQSNNLPPQMLPYQIDVVTRMMYNPQLKGEYTFVPGVIALVLMLVCAMMTSVSIVKEKELGNMEVLLVSPVNPLVVILSKAVPYTILSLIILSIILVMSSVIFHVPINGSLGLLYFVSFLFILSALALGLLISTVTDSQQVAMLISLMALMLPTMMFSGFMFPIESMPIVLQVISNIVPAKWFYQSTQAIMIKGLGIGSIYKEILILSGYTIFFIAVSLRKFKIRLA
jgi:ABC-2 type transport system permease protein